MKEIQAPVDVVAVSRGWWVCRRSGCLFRRYYETTQGAIAGAAKHLRVVHRVRLLLPGAQHVQVGK